MKRILSNPFLSGSIVMILGSNFANAVNYIYHTVIGRLLGPSSYGELTAILSLINLLGIIVASISLVTTKFVSSAKSDKDVSALIGWLDAKINLFSLMVFLVVLIFSNSIANFLNLTTNTLVVIMSFVFILIFPVNLYRALLQGTLKFNKVVISITSEYISKLVIGIALVMLGFSVTGAMFGILISAIIAFGISRYFVRQYFKNQTYPFKDSSKLISFSLPVIMQSFTIASLVSMDLVLVKHFFDTHSAGLYASVSTLGKIIFYAVGPIAAVMFPMVSKRRSTGQSYKEIFLFSLLMSGLIAFIVEALYIWSPEIAIKILFGTAYLQGTNMLVLFGVFMIFYTLSYLFINFFLSIGKTKVVVLPLFAALTQIMGIVIFHSTLIQVIYVSIFSTAILFLALLFYYFYFRDDVIH